MISPGEVRQASAPGRCGLLGNPSDIYGGSVLSCSLGLRATCRLVPAETMVPPEDPTLWNVVAGLQRGPVRVEWTTDIPRSSGLAGSTALLAATLAAVRGHTDDREDLAQTVRRGESEVAGIPCGWQDAYMAAFGGLRLLDFAGFTPDAPGAGARLTPLDAPLPFLLVTTGVTRLSGSVHGPMIDRWKAREPVVRDGVAELATLAAPGAEALLAGDHAALARLMTRNQEIAVAMGGSGEAIDRLIGRCLAHGALAAKLAGAGMGGTVVALTDDSDALEAGLRGEGYVRFARPEIAPGVRMEAYEEPSAG